MSEDEIKMDREIANYLRANINKFDKKTWAILLYLIVHQRNDNPATAIVVKNHEEMLRKQKIERYKAKVTSLKQNSIPKQKIQDKIDELKENIEEYKKWKIKGIETDVDYYDNIADVRTVQVLEELLKGE